MLFSDRSVWTMIHGLVLSGAALMGLFAAFVLMSTMRAAPDSSTAHQQSRSIAWLTLFAAAALWLAVCVGTYVIFPPYRATPPDGATDLSQYPRALIMSKPETRWLHAFAMESKEHVPWIASMLATAVAFVAARYRSQLLSDGMLRTMAMTLLGICFALVAFVGLMGVFINKVAPLQ